MFNGKHVLVTGGAGFIGSHLIAALQAHDCQITATIHKNSPAIRYDNVNYITCDLTKAEDCHRVVEGIDEIFMCAAVTAGAAIIESQPLSQVTPNVLMNTLMLEAAYQAGVKKFLFISSNVVYPDSSKAMAEADMLTGEPFDKYFCVSWMKRFTEILCQMYSQKIKNPLITLIVRPANAYGPGDDFDLATSHVIPALIHKVATSGDEIEVWGDGKDQKDFIYISDLVEGILQVMSASQCAEVYNIGSGKTISINEILAILLGLENKAAIRINYLSDKPTMIKQRLLDTKKISQQFNFRPRIDIAEGLAKTLAWYKDNALRE